MILQYLKPGKENAVSLEYLCCATHLNERKVRRMISEINKSSEEIICSEGRGKGYFIAETKEEADAYIGYNHGYKMDFIEKEIGMMKCRDRKFSGQMCLPGV